MTFLNGIDGEINSGKVIKGLRVIRMLLVFIVAGVVFIIAVIQTLDAFGLAVYGREICAVQYMEADIFVSAIIELHIIHFIIVIGVTAGSNVVDGAGVCGSIFVFFAKCFGDTGGDITRDKTFKCAIVGRRIYDGIFDHYRWENCRIQHRRGCRRQCCNRYVFD